MLEDKDYESVYDWLNDYTTSIEKMDAVERRQETREDYREESQIKADYLDYVDEWKWHNKEQKHQLLEAFLYSISQTHQIVRCNCGNTHTFTTMAQREEGEIAIDEPTILIFTQCWYIHISNQISIALDSLTEEQIRQPTYVEDVLGYVAKWKVTHNLTPMLPLDVFKKIWWDKTLKNKRSTDAIELEQKIPSNDRTIIHAKQKEYDAPIRHEGHRVLLHFVHNEHSFHNLYHALSKADFLIVLKFMNTWRTKIGRSSDKIDLTDIEASVMKCERCMEIKTRVKLTLPGVYYAPPGVGKTTAMESGQIVGVDTDWIGVGPTWRDYSTIFKMKIPIVTNQYTAFVGCGYKVTGVVKSSIRKDSEGKPFTTKQQLLKYAKSHPVDVHFIVSSEKKFFQDHVLRLQIIQQMHYLIANYSMNQMPFYRTEQSEEWAKTYPKLLRKEKFIKLYNINR
ncbi:hypothetical protein [Hubei tetragnatha maxillosa virus 8]|uniref:hypothetical protein n=1 Tax=Hubei tetragnatha maxillosa virus 8 TaxID=1923250 RepID=UPI000909FEA7|nr:hypothetical protein [Hubei tetragnatha maxillosa virus 8]APG78158.1 hypothetical protein [Hubei tetragnatha maxillosa virus 8]APG78236.1 hypothetical protein [Hubei tetragnatha maxillosa virus 8]APG78290.1 hypothetical protein [Hubei tetragnatha maxillosa virus 8]